MKATYNITNDKLKFWPEERLSKETYDRARKCGFTFWHGSKCFAGKWSTQAEDFIIELGGVIEQDDAPDDVESRVERFSKYANRAEQSAESSQEYLESRANTERRRENAINGIERGLSQAEHWKRRIEGAIRNAAYKEQPDVIARRIRGLESDLARYINKSTVYEPQPQCGQSPDQVWVGKGRGGYWESAANMDGIKAHYARWIEHVKRRIEYEMALLEAAGGCHDVLRPKRKIAIMPKGKAKDRKGKEMEVGGAAAFDPSYASNPRDYQWRFIMKVNRSTIEYLTITTYSGETEVKYSGHKTDAYSVMDSKSADEAKAAFPDDFKHFEKVQAILKRNAERKAAKRQEAVAA